MGRQAHHERQRSARSAPALQPGARRELTAKPLPHTVTGGRSDHATSRLHRTRTEQARDAGHPPQATPRPGQPYVDANAGQRSASRLAAWAASGCIASSGSAGGAVSDPNTSSVRTSDRDSATTS